MPNIDKDITRVAKRFSPVTSEGRAFNLGYENGQEDGEKKGKQETIAKVEKIIDKMPHYVLMSNQGEWGISVVELKSKLKEGDKNGMPG